MAHAWEIASRRGHPNAHLSSHNDETATPLPRMRSPSSPVRPPLSCMLAARLLHFIIDHALLSIARVSVKHA